jgi:hypothetical protein
MRYSELKTWEDFAKALCQERNPARLTYLLERLNNALDVEQPRQKAFLPHSSIATQPATHGHADGRKKECQSSAVGEAYKRQPTN